MKSVGEKPLNLKKNRKRKTGSLNQMMEKKTSQPRKKWKKKTGKKDKHLIKGQPEIYKVIQLEDPRFSFS